MIDLRPHRDQITGGIMGIIQLKKELATAKNSSEKIKIKSKIQDITNKAELHIRRSNNEFQYQTREWSIEMLLNMFKDIDEQDRNELYIPDYQRDYKWSKKIASRFIESILLGFPIPYLYIGAIDPYGNDSESDGALLEVIDGSQRLRALYYFVNEKMKLEDLKELTDLNGFTFNDLPSARQRRFLRETLRLVEIRGGIKEDHRRDLFERINTGSKNLVSMEVRDGSTEAQCDFYKKVLIPCSTDPLFTKLAPLSTKKKKNADHREFVLRFFAYFNNMKEYQGKVKEFLDNYLASEAKCEDDNFIEKYINDFNSTMQFINKYIPLGFKKTATSKTTPRARYEALAIGTALALKENENLEPAIDIEKWIFTDKFQEIISADSANNEKQLKRRINYVKNMLLTGHDDE